MSTCRTMDPQTMIGTRLGNWILDKALGQGGMGDVYLAHAADPAADRPTQAAVKVLSPGLAHDPGCVARFQREIEILRQLDHPNIVHCYESGVDKNRFFYVMEYVEGPNCEELVLERGRLPWPEVLDLVLQICPA